MNDQNRIAVIGAGSWGTALVKLLSANSPKVGWWVRKPATIEHIRKYGHNPDYISAAQFDAQRLAMDSDIHAVVKDAVEEVIGVSLSPDHEQLMVSLDLPRAGTVELNLLDSSGRTVRTLLAAKVPMGRQVLHHDIKGLALGTYLVELRMQDLRSTVRFVH